MTLWLTMKLRQRLSKVDSNRIAGQIANRASLQDGWRTIIQRPRVIERADHHKEVAAAGDDHGAAVAPGTHVHNVPRNTESRGSPYHRKNENRVRQDAQAAICRPAR
jgi:hypothetical protein